MRRFAEKSVQQSEGEFIEAEGLVNGRFHLRTNGMLLFSGADKAAALAYAKLFALAQFTLVVREPRRPAG